MVTMIKHVFESQMYKDGSQNVIVSRGREWTKMRSVIFGEIKVSNNVSL